MSASLKTLNVSRITLLWSCLGLFRRRCIHPPVLQSELVIQKLSRIWWRFVAVFATHSLPSSAECRSFSLPSPGGRVHQYRPWYRHLPVQHGLDWGREGLCGYRQLHAGEQRELSHQRRLHLYWSWPGMINAKQSDGELNISLCTLRCPGITRGRDLGGQQQSLLVCCQKHWLQLKPHSVLAFGEIHWYVRGCCSTLKLPCSKGKRLHSRIWLGIRHQLLCPPCSQITALSLANAKIYRKACGAVQIVCGGSWAGSWAFWHRRRAHRSGYSGCCFSRCFSPMSQRSIGLCPEKGVTSLADFSKVWCVSAVLAILKAGRFEINPSSLSAIH